jgi:hypothetical protein
MENYGDHVRQASTVEHYYILITYNQLIGDTPNRGGGQTALISLQHLYVRTAV